MDSVVDIAEQVRRGARRAVDVVTECFRAIDRLNPTLHAFVHLDRDGALSAADSIDGQVARGEDAGLLAGVPFGVKDLQDCRGMPTTQGSLLLKGTPAAEEDSLLVARLRRAGGIPVGKTAASEFGVDSVTHTRAWGTCRNPWDPARTPGGSSGGSASAVAAGMVPFCTASDGGGSIRSPASFCGLLGHKPSFGRIARPDPQRAPFSVWGALTTTVSDTARILDVVSGPDERDKTSLPAPSVSFAGVIEELPVGGLRAAWSADLGYVVVDPEIARGAARAATALVEAAGLEMVDEVLLPANALVAWLPLAAFELRVELEEAGFWPDRADELGETTRRVLSYAEEASAESLARSQGELMRIEQQVGSLFREIDVLLTPTVACAAFAAEGPIPTEIDGRDATWSLAGEPLMMLANVAWNPAVSVPAGLTGEGLPFGIQIMGKHRADEVVLRLARILERTCPWERLAPVGRPG